MNPEAAISVEPPKLPPTLTFRGKFKDRLAFSAYCLPRRPLLVIINLGALLLVTFGSVLPAFRQMTEHGLAVRIITFVFVEILIVGFLAFVLFVIAALSHLSPRNKPFYTEHKITLHDDGFVSESEYGKSDVRWSIVQKLARSRRYIFLLMSAESGLVIPRRAFASNAEWDYAYEFCRQKTQRRK